VRSNLVLSLGSFIAIALSASLASAQTTWYVDVNGTPPGTGTQLDPYTSIQYAISRPTTVNGDSVLVAPGTYLENVDFLGKAIRVASTAGRAATTIDANNVGTVVTFATGESASSVLTGFTLRRGKGPVHSFYRIGGGILCNGASPTLVDLEIRDNTAQWGCGMYLASSSAHVSLCTIENNLTPDVSDVYGVGVYSAYNASPVFETCTIAHNKPGTAIHGGGIFGGGTFHNCTITDNLAFTGGGACASGSSLTFIGCSITNNRTGSNTSDAAEGGGVEGPALLTDCTITGNHGWLNGGGVFNCTLHGCEVAHNTVDYIQGTGPSGHGGGACASVLVDCNVHDNAALSQFTQFQPSSGGGISGGSATRCRIWNNSAATGAGVESTQLENCTVTANNAANPGGGYTFFSGPVNSIHNSIVWNNLPDDIDPTHPTPTVSYSDVTAGAVGTGNIALDPLFFAPGSGDFHLMAGSPCIDSGDPSETDPDNSRIDMGAYPFDPGYCGPFGTYCMAKVNSQDCFPAIGWTGAPKLSGADNFSVTASNELNQRTGIMIWGLTPAATPVLGGVLCMTSFTRTPAQNSGGSALPVIDCSGTYSYFFSHAYMLAHGLAGGTTVYAQYYARDPFVVDGTGASLSNGLQFTICP
jgi:hypothetical protein